VFADARFYPTIDKLCCQRPLDTNPPGRRKIKIKVYRYLFAFVEGVNIDLYAIPDSRKNHQWSGASLLLRVA